MAASVVMLRADSLLGSLEAEALLLVVLSIVLASPLSAAE
jgi:hypothetical protein